MNAWMSPMVIAPAATRSPPTTAMATKLRLPRNIIAGWIDPEMNWAPKLASYSSSFVVAEALLDLVLAPERLDDRVAGERLLDLRVERAGVAPLGDEAGLGALGDDACIVNSDIGTVRARRAPAAARSMNIMISDADQREHRREHLAQRLLQALRDVVDVVGDPAQQVAARLAVDVAERQRG